MAVSHRSDGGPGRRVCSAGGRAGLAAGNVDGTFGWGMVGFILVFQRVVAVIFGQVAVVERRIFGFGRLTAVARAGNGGSGRITAAGIVGFGAF